MRIYFDLLGTEIPAWIFFAGGFLTAFIFTYVSIPVIVKISSFKKLYDFPNDRASHSKATPILGGLAIFAGFSIASLIFTLKPEADKIRYLFAAIVILFFIGLKDDILIIDPKKKFLGQLLSALVIVILGNIRITDFHSVFGLNNVSYIVSIIVSVFILLGLINGFNLIDGVDGLASGIGILITIPLGIWFVLTSNFSYAILCFAFLGTLFAFFRFNVFGKQNKIFMGDTGSMISGLIIAVLIIQFLESESIASEKMQFTSAPAVAFGLVVIPLFDTLRVIIVRLMNGASPFKADKNHIHHSLLKLGYSHLKSTLIILAINIFFISFIMIFQGLGNIPLMIIILIMAVILSALPGLIIKKRLRQTS